MTIEQIQCLLKFLGYYHGNIDGIFGDKTLDAVICFQDDFGAIAVDGDPGKNTQKALRHAVAYGMPERKPQDEPENGDFWDDIEFFDRDEFRCKCGGKYCDGFPAEPDEKMVRYADEIRRRLGVTLRVNSGLRCKVWNQKNNGASQSQHMTGFACDLGCPKGITTEKMASVAEEVIGNTGGIGIYDWGIHIDSRSIKARWNG